MKNRRERKRLRRFLTARAEQSPAPTRPYQNPSVGEGLCSSPFSPSARNLFTAVMQEAVLLPDKCKPDLFEHAPAARVLFYDPRGHGGQAQLVKGICKQKPLRRCTDTAVFHRVVLEMDGKLALPLFPVDMLDAGLATGRPSSRMRKCRRSDAP